MKEKFRETILNESQKNYMLANAYNYISYFLKRHFWTFFLFSMEG